MCLQEFIDTVTQWVCGLLRLVTGHTEAEVAEVKPSVTKQDYVKPIQISTTINQINE